MYKKISLVVYVTIYLLFLTGCVPVYTPPSPENTVPINISDLQTPQICVNHSWYTLEKGPKGFAYVPYGQRITVGNNFSLIEDDGMFTRSVYCDPILSFIPRKGHRYALFFSQYGTDCGISIFKYKQNTRLGVTPESSIKKGAC